MPATLNRTAKHIRQDLHALDQRERTAREEASGLYAKARGESRSLSDAEKARDAELKSQLSTVAEERRELREELENAEALARIECAAPRIESVREGWESDPKHGFRSHQDFLMQVMAAGRTGRVAPNLAQFGRKNGEHGMQATAGSDEQSTTAMPYGGFLIPKTLLPGLESTTAEGDPLYTYTRKITMDTPAIKVNARVDKTHSTSVSGGLVVYRVAETQSATASRMAFEQVELEANDLIGVTYASNRLLRASPVSFVSLLTAGFADEFGAKLTEERLNGNGAGMYAGVANSSALITQTKESGQAADTITWTNILKMWSRCYRPGQAVWVVNHSCLPQIMAMTQPGGTVPVFSVGAGGVQTMLGRPVIVTERAAAIGDLGDIALLNFSEYLEGEFMPMESASSIHVRFLENEETFKFWKCNAGAPWWTSVLTPKRGTTLSPFVYLEAR